ncbi:MAG: hypothetical protein KIT20_05420 [Alphaproteobacteria bacterium]|nr:hypothetical protein [Alphaproteobacteria bacterium]
MQERPDAGELLEAIGEFLAREVRPKLDPVGAFHARVAERLLELLRREWRDGPAADRAEHARLRALLGGEGTLAELNRRLARDIRARRLAGREAELVDHLKATVADRLAIDNPRHAGAP